MIPQGEMDKYKHSGWGQAVKAIHELDRVDTGWEGY
jgi:hypothetical protein